MATPPEDTVPSRPRVLYIHPGNNPPSLNPERNAAYHLSKRMDGDLVSMTWDSKKRYEELRPAYEEALGSWGYHASASNRWGIAGMLLQAFYYFAKSIQLSMKNGRYDAVVAYGPFKTGWAALMVKVFTGAKLIVQMPMNPYRSLSFHDGPLVEFKARLLELTLPLLMKFTDRLHFMYAEQAETLPVDPLPPSSAFPDFVPTSLVPSNQGEEGFILFLGFPWRLKGVDILIEAFNRISPEFPDIKLRVIGHCPDTAPWEEMAGGNDRIEFHGRALEHEEAMDLMSRCNFFVLPSRTEGMPRVIQEAWAAGKAVVASAVDGIPYYVQDGENGLLFANEDAEALANHLRHLLGNPDEARRLGANGSALIHGRYGEEHYSEYFFDMVQETLRNRRR